MTNELFYRYMRHRWKRFWAEALEQAYRGKVSALGGAERSQRRVGLRTPHGLPTPPGQLARPEMHAERAAR